MALKLKHQTTVEFLVRAKRRYEQATGYEAARIAKKIDEWLASGDLKEEEVAKAWGAATVEEKAWTDAKKEIGDLKTALASIEAVKPSTGTAASVKP